MSDEKKMDVGRNAQQQHGEAQDIIRISGRDVNGNYKMEKALMQIKGIGNSMAHAIALSAERKLGIPASTKIGSLSEKQLESLEKIIKDPASVGLPEFMLNRRKDLFTGKSMHLTGSDLIVMTRQDVDFEVKLQTWRGYRHQYGQKVRGQRTRSTGRTGSTVGVTKKTELKKAAEAGAGGKESKEKK